MKKQVLMVLVTVTLVACSANPTLKKTPRISTAELLSGEVLFGAIAETIELPEVDILALDEAMKRFVRETIPAYGNNHFRSKRLIEALFNRGLLDLDYDSSKTYTAIETFHNRAGNCLSFTNLFVALAREAGIKARFQQVGIPPVWSQKDDFTILNNHINVKLESSIGPNYEVDFNQVDYKGSFESWLITDKSAFAQYYNNLGVNSLQKSDYLNAFTNFKKAIQMDSTASDYWVNLGVLFSRNKLYAHAEASYLHALKVDHRAKLASSNLAKLYQHLGDTVNADYYRAKVAYFRNSNPYYHYWLARKSFKEKQYQASVDSLERALSRKDDEHLFYFLLGANYLQMGQEDKAQYFFNQAVEHANNKTQGRYLSKIERLMKGKS